MKPLYRPLGGTDIRLLTVNVDHEDAVSIELTTYTQESVPDYDAVSYAWGEDTSTYSVLCNGLPLEIRTNLYRALPFLHGSRPEPKTRPLWIDAICLNQSDPDEKATHIPNMGKIFANAQRTLVWLGEAADDSDLAIDNIESLTQKLFQMEDYHQSSLGVEQALAKYNLPPSTDPRWVALTTLHMRTWFYRLWALQEIVLSTAVIVMCGDKSMPWHSLEVLLEAVRQANMAALVYFQSDMKPSFKGVGPMLQSVNHLRKHHELGDELLLPFLLIASADRDYSLPVDRFWALLGMLNKTDRLKIEAAGLIDYSEAGILNYHKTSLRLMQFYVEYDSHQAVALIEYSLRNHNHTTLPSWCPDWNFRMEDIQYPTATQIGMVPETLVGIPGGRYRLIKPWMQVNDDSSLELCGLKVDVVRCVTASTCQNLWHYDCIPWLLECFDIIQSSNFHRCHANYPHQTSSALWTDNAGDPTELQLWEERSQRLHPIIDVLCPPGLFETLTARKTMAWCEGSKFFRTKDGRLGIGPACLEEGDILCAMYGAQVLWALRPYGRAEGCPKVPMTIEEQEFEFLGKAYTPSLLKGEAWVGRSCEDMHRFRLR